jgi:hypothetical protein
MTWIYFAGNTKIKSPTDDATRSFVGDVTNYDFKYQIDNFNKLNQILQAYGVILKNVVSGSYPVKYNTTRTLTKFLVYNDERTVVWNKYEGNVSGGGQNNLLLCSPNNSHTKIKISDIVSDDPSKNIPALNILVNFLEHLTQV